MPFQKGNKHGKRGARPGKAGRKPKAITLFTRSIKENGVEDANYAYSLFVSVMRDKQQPLSFRVDCANKVLDRVSGKPATVIMGDKSRPVETNVNIIRVRDIVNAPLTLPPLAPVEDSFPPAVGETILATADIAGMLIERMGQVKQVGQAEQRIHVEQVAQPEQ